MKVVLRSDVDNVGKKGDIVDVSAGFGRNYLLRRGLAFTATEGATAQATAMRRSRDLNDAKERSAGEEVARVLVPKVITITAKAGTEGRLFGSVTSADVVDAIAAQAGIELDRRKLHLAEPIKTLGTHEVPARLHPDVEFAITVEVVSTHPSPEHPPTVPRSGPTMHRVFPKRAPTRPPTNGICPLATHKSVPQG